MKTKRIIFVLFTSVFALYGCVSAEAMKTSATLTANNDLSVSKDTMHTQQFLKQLLDNKNQTYALKAFAKNNAETALYTSVRDTNGNIITKIDVNNISKDLYVHAQEKRAEEEAKAKRLAEEEKRKAELEEAAKKATSEFNPRITTYGLDCYGCQSVNGRGGTAMGVALDLALGVQQPDGSWQAGIQYGSYFIIAADRSVPMCSIVRIEDHGLGGDGLDPNQPIYAIVLDRGGGISGSHLDLYVGSEASNSVYRAYQGNPKAQVIRTGGQNGNSCSL